MDAWPLTLAVVSGLGLLGAVLYWEFIVSEGAHLGSGVVIWLYDLVARRYEQIKKFKLDLDDSYLGLPLAVALVEVEVPRVLDVAAGTGRGARSLLRQVAFDGAIINVELSARMLAEGRRLTALWPGRSAWVRGPADRLPFPAEIFDVVMCLEALEFFPNPRAALTECMRVLRPGGWLVVTNRVGLSARLMAGKTFSRSAFRRLLEQYPLEALRVEPWQTEYDLGRGRKRLSKAAGAASNSSAAWLDTGYRL